jgi:DNA polymerase-3 subunit epsilon
MPIALSSLEVLVVDCQATAAPPAGELLEIGWARARAGESVEPGVEAHVVAPAVPLRLAPRVRRLTGLTEKDLKRGTAKDHVGARLAAALEAMRASAAAGPSVAVAHFSRFEAPFVGELLRGRDSLGLEWVCTHAIARRLLPTLPRRGLRALAGYLGEAVPELRRAPHHVAASVRVWRELIGLVARERGIRTLEELRGFCAEDPPPRGARVYPLGPEARRALPDAPGVYRFRRAGGSVLYVGKAKSLRHRVSSYFQASRGHDDRTLEVLAQARDVDFTLTGTALEAALLEPDEIKRFEPPYNVALRERDRKLAYWSASLRHVAPRADERHPVGPFLLAADEPPLSALLAVLDARGAPAVVDRLRPAVLGVPRRHAPALACFRAGLSGFVRRHRLWHGGPPTPAALLRLALRLGRIPEAAAGAGGEAGARDRWTAESVAGALEEVVRRGALAVRRARWLCALGESSVAWSAATHASTGRRTCLILSRGAIVERLELAPGEDLPPPPGHATPRRERQHAFDLAVYDRLGALSRELKRLVAEDPRVELRLGPGRVLDRAALEAALRWL